jgi:hypothetical protein
MVAGPHGLDCQASIETPEARRSLFARSGTLEHTVRRSFLPATGIVSLLVGLANTLQAQTYITTFADVAGR